MVGSADTQLICLPRVDQVSVDVIQVNKQSVNTIGRKSVVLVYC